MERLGKVKNDLDRLWDWDEAKKRIESLHLRYISGLQ